MSTISAVAERQRPLRDLYRVDTDAAITVKRARSVPALASDPLHAAVEVFGDSIPVTRWDVGVDAKVGGLDDLPNPGHLLCAALAACADTTLRMVADHLGVRLQRLSVDVRGEVDCRGCLAIDADVAVGFRSIDVTVDLTPSPDANDQMVQLLREMTERLCVVLATLRDGVPVSISYT